LERVIKERDAFINDCEKLMAERDEAEELAQKNNIKVSLFCFVEMTTATPLNRFLL
jgi:hypothetical protein